MTDRLFINGKEVELSPGTVIALTFQINDLSDLKDRQANLSNQFKVPKTKANAIILESCELVTSTSQIPYQKSTAMVNKGGIEIHGVIIVQNTNEFYNNVFYSGLFDFFALIDGKKLKDVDLSTYDHWFDFAAINTSRPNTTGYKYPIIDYGSLPTSSRDVQPANMRPAVFVHTLIDQIFSAVGINKSGALFLDSNYLKLMLPFSADIFNTPKQLVKETISIANTEQWTLTLEITLNVTSWADGYSRLEFGLFYGSSFNSFYTHPDSGSGGGTGTFNLNIPINVSNVTSSFRPYFFYDPHGNVASGTFSTIFSGIELINGTRFKVELINDSFGGSGSFTRLLAWSGRTWVYLQDTLADMTQTDFVKGIFNSLFAAIYKSDYWKNELIFATFKEISDNCAIAKDWSDKLQDDDKVQVDYHAAAYAQTNYLRYKVDSNDKDLTPQTFDSSFTISDQTLQAEKLVIQSPFAATLMETMLQGLDVPLIRKINNGNFEISTEPRLLVDDTRSISGAPIDFKNSVTITTNVPLCYFSLAGKSFNLDYAFIKAAFFTELINSLTDYKKLTPQFYIKEIDINELDHFIPIYASKYNQYFYVNKILNWKDNEPTKTEIIKL